MIKFIRFYSIVVGSILLRFFNYFMWIIVTSVNEPTEQIKKLAAIKEFQLLVVGDVKTNQNWTHNNSIFLSVADQEALGFGIYPDIPFKSYTRKNIGNLSEIKWW